MKNRKDCIGFKFRRESIAPGSGSCLMLVQIFPEIAQVNLHTGYNYCQGADTLVNCALVHKAEPGFNYLNLLLRGQQMK